MKILAIDSSGLVASVAVVEDETLLAEFTIDYKKTHSQTLLPMLDQMAKMIELDLNSIERSQSQEDRGLLPDFGSDRLQRKALDWHLISRFCIFRRLMRWHTIFTAWRH